MKIKFSLVVFFILLIILIPALASVTSLDLNTDLIKTYNELHEEDDPDGLLPQGSQIASIKGTPNIQIAPDNPAITNYLEISSAGEGSVEISANEKKYGFLISQTDSLTINAISSEIKEGSFSLLPFRAASEFIFENGILKSKQGIKIEYTSSNSELKIKFLGLTILNQDALENFNADISTATLPVGGIYPLNAKLKTSAISNLEYLGSSYEIPSNAEVKIVYGKLILPEGTKVKSFSSLKEDFFKSISEKLGFNFNENKIVSFEGKNIDLGNGLIAEIPKGASIDFDNNGNLLVGHTAGKEVMFNNGIDVRVSGAKDKTEGVYIFKNLAEAKASGHENYLSFGKDFDAHLGDTSKSGKVEALFNRENPYVPIGENTHFSILGGARANEISSEIKIRSFNEKELAVIDNKGFMILNDNTKTNFIFSDIEGEQGKVLRMEVGNYLNKEQVPMLVRNQLDKKFKFYDKEIKETVEKEIQIASLYSDIKKEVYFTSNIETAEDLVIDSNLLSYKDNFKPTIAKEIPFMKDVFKEDVQVTMKDIEKIKDKDFIALFEQDYKPGYKGFKIYQDKYKDAYFDVYKKIAKDKGLSETKAREVYDEAKAIVNNPDYDFSTRNYELKKLFERRFHIDYYPTLKLKDVDSEFKEDIISIVKFYYEAEKREYLLEDSSKFSLDHSEKEKIDKLTKKGMPIEKAIEETIKIGPNTMFGDPYVPPQKWWSILK